MFWKKAKLTKREKEIRALLLNEHARAVCYTEKNAVPYAYGKEDEAREILGKVMNILGG
jgi:hypothetical protein